MKTAWLGSMLFHVALAGGLLWCAVAQPPVVEIRSVDAVTVSLVNGSSEPAGAGATAAPSPTVTPPIEPMRVVSSRHDAFPTQPRQVETPVDVTVSDPPAPSPAPPDPSVPIQVSAPPSLPDVAAVVDAGGAPAPDGGMEGDGEMTTAEPAGGVDPWPAFFTAVQAAVQRVQHYPFSARLAGLEDRVKVTFRITADGSAEQIIVTETSRFPILNEAAVDTVRRVARFPAPPLRENQSGVRITVPLEFTLHVNKEKQPE